MEFFADVKECWNENPRLFVRTVAAGVALGLLAPAAIILMLAM